jgi:DNA-binding GntR family transcriptional regulator
MATGDGLGGNLKGLAPIARQTLHERVYNEFRRAIMVASFHPGADINLKSLAQAMGTSEMPVRDAVRRLMATRAIEMLPNRRIRIPNPTVEQYREVLRLRLALEGEATEVACAKLTAEQLRALRATYRELVHSAGGRITPESLSRNYEFHFQIYSAAQMPVLISFVESLWLLSGPLFNLQPLDLPRRRRDFHAIALEALERRDAAAAAAAIRDDIATTGELIIARLQEREAQAEAARGAG